MCGCVRFVLVRYSLLLLVHPLPACCHRPNEVNPTHTNGFSEILEKFFFERTMSIEHRGQNANANEMLRFPFCISSSHSQHMSEWFGPISRIQKGIFCEKTTSRTTRCGCKGNSEREYGRTYVDDGNVVSICFICNGKVKHRMLRFEWKDVTVTAAVLGNSIGKSKTDSCRADVDPTHCVHLAGPK